MDWIAPAASLAGAAIGAFGNKKKGPSLAENMNTMYGTWGTAQAANLAQQFQNTGGPQYYPGQTLADLSPYTWSAIGALYNRGQQSNPALDAASASNTATSQGQYLYSNPALTELMGFQSNANPATEALQAFANGGAYGSNPAQGYFQNATNGAYVGSNPYLTGMFNAASGDVTNAFRNSIAPGLASQFAAAGRTGSGASQGAFSDASRNLLSKLNDLGSNIYGTAYENERNRQQGAAGQLAAINQFDRSQQLSALNTLSGNYYTGQGQRLNALGQAGDLYGRERQLQQAANALAPSLAAQDWVNIQNMLQAGQMLDQRNQAVIDDQRARWDFEQNRPYNFAADFTKLIAGNPGASAFARNPASPPQQNMLISGLGGAMAGARLGSIFGDGGGIEDIIGSIFGGAGKSLLPTTDASQYADFWA